MSNPGLSRKMGPAAAALLLIALAPIAGCTKGEGAKCTHDTACNPGLACVFTDIAVVDCCSVDTSGRLTCDPNDFSIVNRGIAPDCEYDANGLLKPRLRRLTCLGATYEDYKLWTGVVELDDMGNPTTTPELLAIGLDAKTLSFDLTDACSCEPGANFTGGDPTMPYDPILSAGPDVPLCPRGTTDSVDPPTVANPPADCPNPPADDTCPPCVAFTAP
jgi:hypothetical protein